MGRHSCCVKQKLRKGLWSPEEDEKLFNYITRFGVGCWSSVPKLAGNNLYILNFFSSITSNEKNMGESFLTHSMVNLQDCKDVERVAG